MGSTAGHAPVTDGADETISWSHSWTRTGAAIPCFFVDLSCHQQWDVPIDAMGARRPSDSEAGGCPGVARGGPSFCPWIGQKLIRQIPTGFQISAYLSLTQIRRLNQGRRRSLASEAAQTPRGESHPQGVVHPHAGPCTPNRAPCAPRVSGESCSWTRRETRLRRLRSCRRTWPPRAGADSPSSGSSPSREGMPSAPAPRTAQPSRNRGHRRSWRRNWLVRASALD